jgi:GT2 family glycosyltransferase
MTTVSFVVASPHLPTVGRTVASILGLTDAADVREILVMGADRHGVIARDDRVRIVDGLPPGPACRAYNAGIDLAVGDRVVLLDGDCVLDPDWLRPVRERHAEGRNVVSGGVVIPPGDYLPTVYNYTMFHRFLASRPPGPRSYLSTMNLSLDREAIARVGPVPEDMPRTYDFEWTLRMSEAGLKLFFEPRARVAHHPCGVTPGLLWRAWYVGGACSQAVRGRHRERIRGEALFAHPWLLAATAPLLALAATARVATACPTDPRLWACLPAVWVTKLAWCLGASAGRRRGVMATEAYTIRVPRGQ